MGGERLAFLRDPRFDVTLLLAGLALLARFVGNRLIDRRAPTPNRRYHWRRALNLVLGLGLILSLFFLWLGTSGQLLTALGFVSLALAFVLRELFLNLSAWLWIIFGDLFRVGSRIQIGDVVGDVVDIGLFSTLLVEVAPPELGGQSTARLVRIPNAWLFSRPLTHGTYLDFLWDELAFPVSEGLDPETVEADLKALAPSLPPEAAQRLQAVRGQLPIHFAALGPTVFLDWRDDRLYLTLRYPVSPRQRRQVRDRILREVRRRWPALVGR